MTPMPALVRTEEPETAKIAEPPIQPPREEPIGPPPPTAEEIAAARAAEEAALTQVELQKDEARESAAAPARTPFGFFGGGGLTGTDLLPGLLMTGGVLLMLFILMRRLWHRRGDPRRPGDQTPQERIAAIRARAQDRADIEAFKVDAHEFTRRLAAMLDGKAERLEQLIVEAEEKIGTLRELQSRDPGRSARAAPAAPPRPGPIDPGPASPADSVHERIYRLADAGMSAIEIARQTGQPTGQIELILALRG